ncbi:hypothetical protein BDV32DRAFT_123481 [Aspergillus pseudonomiae]|nr:hypothetical protein BDV32DRAFT_123481 [Aspergillus pseudonomiae]
MGDEDPVILAQAGKKISDKRIAAYKDMSERYSRYLRDERSPPSPLANSRPPTWPCELDWFM